MKRMSSTGHPPPGDPPGMPVSNPGPALVVGNPEEPSLVAGTGLSEGGHGAREELGAILEAVKARTGHDFGSYKKTTILRRVQRRMAVHEVGGLGRYLCLIKDSPEEAQALAQDIMIGVTRFFRDPDAFAALKGEVLPRLFSGRSPDEPVRIWHACCATGEEVYSMAILIREYLEEKGVEARVQLFATDIDESAICQARAGIYPDDIAETVANERLTRFFLRVNDRWQVTKEIREMVVFAHHSLIKDPPFSRLDLLVCRNFLIYLNQDMQRRLITLFHMVVRPKGFLFLGSAETVGPQGDLFRVVDKKWKIFQRLEGARRREALFPFLTPPAGQLRPLCAKSSPFDGKVALVVFEAQKPASASHPLAPVVVQKGHEPKDLLIQQLEAQLRLSVDELHASLEQLEVFHEGYLSAQEELTSISEEYQSANEELQFSNEELETSKEELLALNEELVMVNAELKGTVDELNLAKTDLETLLTISDIAVLFLDQKLNVKRYSPALATLFHFIAADVGRPLSHLAGANDWSELMADSEKVLKSGIPVEREVTLQKGGRHYLLRVLPCLGTEGVSEGVVLTLFDITERKRLEERLIKSK